jgi:hypothetical protein
MSKRDAITMVMEGRASGDGFELDCSGSAVFSYKFAGKVERNPIGSLSGTKTAKTWHRSLTDGSLCS